MKRCVLVIGAGASRPYGLPTAGELREAIVRLPPALDRFPLFLRPPAEGGQDLRVAQAVWGWTPERFVEELRLSGSPTIDAWIASPRLNEWARRFARLAIMNAIVPAEWGLIGDARLSSDWLAGLFNSLVVGRNKGLDLARVSVVTFNYDSLLEMAFIQMARARLRWDRDRARTAIERWGVVHVFGTTLWQSRNEILDALESWPDGAERQRLSESWLGFRTGGELNTVQPASESPENQQEIRRRIWDAERVVFLGFGFDRTNLEVLGIGDAFDGWTRSRREVFATGFGLGGAARATVERVLRSGASRLILGREDQDCDSFLRANDPFS